MRLRYFLIWKKQKKQTKRQNRAEKKRRKLLVEEHANVLLPLIFWTIRKRTYKHNMVISDSI